MIHLLHVIQQQRYEDKGRNGLSISMEIQTALT